VKRIILIISFFILLPLSLFGAQQENKFAYLLEIEGGINPASADYIRKGLEKAKSDGAGLVLIRLNTPGGLLTSTRKIVQSMLVSEVPVVVYIAPSGAHAGSAGVMVTLAANIAAMAPATNIGAAHPVAGTGKDLAKKMNEKVENDTIAFVKSIAEHRKRNVKWAEVAVKKSSSLTSEEALKKKVVDFIASDIGELLKKINGKKVTVHGKGGKKIALNTDNIELRSFKMNTMQKIIMLISEPNIAYLLMMAGMLGLYVEFTNPGLIFPGVAGAVSLVLAFVSLQTLPINIGALLLILLGIAFLIAEIFVTSFGVLSVGGLISLFIGSIFLIDEASTDATISYSLIIPTIVVLAGFILIIGVLLVKSKFIPVATGSKSMEGRNAVVELDLSPEGKVFIDGCLWNAESESGESLKKGEKVTISKVDGLKFFVKKT